MSSLPILHGRRPGRHLAAVPDPDLIVLRLAGELDVARLEEIREQVSMAVADGHREIGLDLAEVTFMDCSSLGVLIACRRQVREAGGRLRITEASQPVRRVLDLTGTGPALGCH